MSVDLLSYRGEVVYFKEDTMGMQMYATWRGKEYCFGFGNTFYKEDMQHIIDDQLDTITRFEQCPEFYGCRLAWFVNGTHEDIQLIYRQRILKVFLVADKNLVNVEAIKAESIKILSKIILADKAD